MNAHSHIFQDIGVSSREASKTSGAGHEDGKKVRTVAPGGEVVHTASPTLSRRGSEIRPGGGGGKILMEKMVTIFIHWHQIKANWGPILSLVDEQNEPWLSSELSPVES